MKHEDRKAHEITAALFAALNYTSGQIAAVLGCSPKAAQLKKKMVNYSKFTAADLNKVLAFFDALQVQRRQIISELDN